ncbi:MAG TPA: hypothetical protein VHE30_12145 [Polyangiaceae bacterium]|nr:hypothetical protein [Polyangiaceae bacterium]
MLSLKQNPDREKLVPQSLWKYFDEPILVSGWYPERDYWILIAALVKTIPAASVGGDVWRYFAKFSAQRDIGGQEQKGVGDKAGVAGLYRNFASVDESDLGSFFLRATRLWSQYHDTGKMEIVGARKSERSVVMRLVGFVIPIEGFVRLQGYYLEEYGALVGIEVRSVVTKSTANGDPFCEWEHRLARTPAADAYVASLPPI